MSFYTGHGKQHNRFPPLCRALCPRPRPSSPDANCAVARDGNIILALELERLVDERYFNPAERGSPLSSPDAQPGTPWDTNPFHPSVHWPEWEDRQREYEGHWERATTQLANAVNTTAVGVRLPGA